MSIPCAPDDLPERFRVMKRQEVTAYNVQDYLSPNYIVPTDVVADPPLCQTSSSNTCTSSVVGVAEDKESEICVSSMPNSSAAGVNKDWRSRICEWSYQVIDHFDYDQEIVAVSLSYLDRYLCRRPVNKRTFQLVAMTTLYLACKLYDPHKLRMASLIELSRGYFTPEHITAMEESVLNKLSWQLHPPTPLTFVRHYVLLLKPTACEPRIWHEMMEVAKFITELAVIDYHFAPLKPSSVGLAALMTAMEGIDSTHLSDANKQAFAKNVYRLAQVSPNNPEVMNCRTRLRAMYYQGGVYQQQQEAEAAAAAQAARDEQLSTERIPQGAQPAPVAAEARATIRSGSPSGVAETVATARASSGSGPKDVPEGSKKRSAKAVRSFPDAIEKEAHSDIVAATAPSRKNRKTRK